MADAVPPRSSARAPNMTAVSSQKQDAALFPCAGQLDVDQVLDLSCEMSTRQRPVGRLSASWWRRPRSSPLASRQRCIASEHGASTRRRSALTHLGRDTGSRGRFPHETTLTIRALTRRRTGFRQRRIQTHHARIRHHAVQGIRKRRRAISERGSRLGKSASLQGESARHAEVIARSCFTMWIERSESHCGSGRGRRSESSANCAGRSCSASHAKRRFSIRLMGRERATARDAGASSAEARTRLIRERADSSRAA